LKARIKGHDKLGNRRDIWFYLYTVITKFSNFKSLFPVVLYLSCYFLSPRPTTIIMNEEISSETSVTTYYSKRCRISEHWNLGNYEFIRLLYYCMYIKFIWFFKLLETRYSLRQSTPNITSRSITKWNRDKNSKIKNMSRRRRI
jgi:hypothetical protein